MLHVGAVAVSAIVDGGDLDTTAVGPAALPAPPRRLRTPDPAARLELTVTPGRLQDLLAGGPAPRVAAPELLARFRRTFRIDPGERAPVGDASAA